MARPRDIAESRAERARWEAAGRPAPTPSGAPRLTGRREVKPAEVKPELAKTPAELEKGFALAQIRAGKMPEGSKVLSRNADGTPETYEYQGQTYYAPGSVQYETGWRSQEEYMKGQKFSAYGGEPGKLVPKDVIEVTLPRGARVEGHTRTVVVPTDKPIEHRYLARAISKGKYKVPVEVYDVTGKKRRKFITPEQSKELSELTGEAQFKQMKKMGILPPGAMFHREYEEGRGWTYTLPAETRVDTEALEAQIAAQTEYRKWQWAMKILAPYTTTRQVRDGIISHTPPMLDVAGFLQAHETNLDYAESVLSDAGFTPQQIAKFRYEAFAGVPEKIYEDIRIRRGKRATTFE